MEHILNSNNLGASDLLVSTTSKSSRSMMRCISTMWIILWVSMPPRVLQQASREHDMVIDYFIGMQPWLYPSFLNFVRFIYQLWPEDLTLLLLQPVTIHHILKSYNLGGNDFILDEVDYFSICHLQFVEKHVVVYTSTTWHILTDHSISIQH